MDITQQTGAAATEQAHSDRIEATAARARTSLVTIYTDLYAMRDMMTRAPLRLGQLPPTDSKTLQHIAASRALDALQEAINALSQVAPPALR